MSIIPALTPKEVMKALLRNGFVLIRTRGSHHVIGKGSSLVVIPIHNRDLKKGTLHIIIHDSGMSVEDFLKLL